MNFGLTGIGIGGLFYIGCAFVILIIEGYKKISNRYHVHPRQLIIDIVLILSGIVGATLATDRGLELAMRYIGSRVISSELPNITVPGTGLTEIRSIIFALGILFIVLTITNLLRFVVPAKKIS
jgi:hypothetical protein